MTSYLWLSLCYFASMSSLTSTVDELSAKARKQLPWNEYFALKRDNKISLDRNDEKYATQNVDSDNLPEFLNQFVQQDKKQILPIIFYLSYMIVLVTVDFAYKKHSNLIPFLKLFSYTNILLIPFICYYYFKWELPLKIKQFRFAKEIDHLIYENKLRIWK